MTERQKKGFWNKYHLNKKQFEFAEDYIKTGIAAISYRKAYPKASKATSQVNGFRLLRNPYVNAYIRYRQKQIMETTNTDLYWLVDKLKNIVESNGSGGDKLKALEIIRNIIVPLEQKPTSDEPNITINLNEIKKDN